MSWRSSDSGQIPTFSVSAFNLKNVIPVLNCLLSGNAKNLFNPTQYDAYRWIYIYIYKHTYPSGQLRCTQCVHILGFTEQKQKMLQRLRPTKLTNKTWPKSWTGMQYRDVEILCNLGDGISCNIFLFIYSKLSFFFFLTGASVHSICVDNLYNKRKKMKHNGDEELFQTQTRQSRGGWCGKNITILDT